MAGKDVNAREVNFAGKACTLRAYVAEPSHGGHQHPAIIVVQEWWGLDEHIKDVARRLAPEHYFAVAPDLYSRQGNKVTHDPNVAGQLMSGLKQSDGIDDLLSTVDWLKAQAGVRASHIGVIGFCMGGSYAMALPCVSPDINAAAPFYGEIPPDDKLQSLTCPVFYAYGENDGWIQRKDVDRLANALRKFNKPGEVKVYAGCSHGFFNDTRADVYSANDARDAWQRSLKLFEEKLKH
ncbi:MAG: dienelactone hydrolase family protein [Deltaproteobacteria bacterium]|nr:dienelactone hydrolase family protein [Deltaproteobacteria bacterium]